MNYFPPKLSSLLIFFAIVSLPQISMSKELVPPIKAPDSYFMSQGEEIKLSEFQGKKTILWLFSTWCHTCAAGVKAFAKKKDDFEKYNITLITLRNHKNGGYPGPSINEFIDHYVANKELTKNWVIGETSKMMDKQYNSIQYPDIFFLIDENGIIQEQGTAPAVYIKKIMHFVKKKAKTQPKHDGKTQ